MFTFIVKCVIATFEVFFNNICAAETEFQICRTTPEHARLKLFMSLSTSHLAVNSARGAGYIYCVARDIIFVIFYKWNYNKRSFFFLTKTDGLFAPRL